MARIRCVILFREQSMATATKQVSIQDFVAQLRTFPESAFDETEHVRRFLQDSPLNPDSLAPYLIEGRYRVKKVVTAAELVQYQAPPGMVDLAGAGDFARMISGRLPGATRVGSCSVE